MSTFPLLFNFHQLLAGRGFFAGVSVNGRVLLVQEDEGCWLYGVNPGGVAGCGRDRAEAFKEFKRNYLAVLFDFAEQAPSYDAFHDEVQRFFNEVNVPNEHDWLDALEKVRAGQVTLDGLRKQQADATAVAVEVVRVDVPAPSANALDEDYAEAA